MLQSQTILQHFYKMLMCQPFIGFHLGPPLISFFHLANDHSPYQQFVKKFVK